MTVEEQIKDLKTLCRQLSIAFKNVDAERMFLRKQNEKLRETLRNLASDIKHYEGQDNIYEPPEDVIQRTM